MNRPIALITGATAGIGLETARALARKDYRILLHGRNMDKAEAAAREIRGGSVSPVAGDLSRQDDIRALAETVRAKCDRLDVLVNNAGTWNSHRVLTEEGIEKTFAINHLAYFMLTALLHDHLTEAGRIVCVSSDSHKQVKGMRFGDLGLSKGYHGLRSYAQSKLANLLFCAEYERRKSGSRSIYAVQPGLVSTDIGLKGNTWLHALAWRVRRKMSGNKTPAEGAATSVYLASTDRAPQSGLYYDDCRPKPPGEAAGDRDAARRLWEESERLTGVSFQP